MSALHRITSPLLVTLALFGATACTNKKEIKYAKESVYDADFAIVYTAALAATRDLYPKLDDMPGKGTVRTAWHPVPLASTSDDSQVSNNAAASSAGMQSQGMGASNGATSAGMPSRMARTQQFVRFDVAVVGGRPWHVRVNGHASEWQPGMAIPTELTGAAKPPWLDGRIDALRVAIYRKLHKFAQKMPAEKEPGRPEDLLPKTDAKTFANIPPGAANRLAQLKDSLVRRDNGSLRDQVADDVVWSLGGDPGAETAMAMWQADPDTLDTMAKLVVPPAAAPATPPDPTAPPATVGCGGTATRVACPAGDPVPGAFQLVIELRGGEWKVTSFVRAE